MTNAAAAAQLVFANAMAATPLADKLDPALNPYQPNSIAAPKTGRKRNMSVKEWQFALPPVICSGLWSTACSRSGLETILNTQGTQGSQ